MFSEEKPGWVTKREGSLELFGRALDAGMGQKGAEHLNQGGARWRGFQFHNLTHINEQKL